MIETKEREFPHDMLREIYEQPDALRRTLDDYTASDSLLMEKFSAGSTDLASKHRMLIAAGGPSKKWQ